MVRMMLTNHNRSSTDRHRQTKLSRISSIGPYDHTDTLPLLAAVVIDESRAGSPSCRNILACTHNGNASINRHGIPKIIGAVTYVGQEHLLMHPGGTFAAKKICGSGTHLETYIAAVLADEGHISIDGHGKAEFIVKPRNRRGKLRLELPNVIERISRRTLIVDAINVRGTGSRDNVIITLGTDQDGIATDRHRLTKPIVVGRPRRQKLTLLLPTLRVDIVPVNIARTSIIRYMIVKKRSHDYDVAFYRDPMAVPVVHHPVVRRKLVLLHPFNTIIPKYICRLRTDTNTVFCIIRPDDYRIPVH